MIKIYPSIDHSFFCPECQTLLKHQQFVLNGIRSLVKTSCPGCARQYFADLPTSQAIYTPLMIDIQTKKIYGTRQLDWFADPLRNGLNNIITAPIKIKKTVYQKSSQLVLINCLDYLYGHSLLKLLNTQKYLDGGHKCWLIVPPQLVHLVPAGIAQLWVVNIRFSQANNWFDDLNRQVRREISSKKTVYLAKLLPHPNYTAFNISNFVHLPKSIAVAYSRPIVTYAYRPDRSWGGHPYLEWLNLLRFCLQLRRRHPQVSLVLTGFKNDIRFPKFIHDLRAASPSIVTEKEWLKIWSASDCAIGVHGSNMLLPSSLAKTTLEFLPQSRWGNILQDYIPPRKAADTIESLYRMRILYGNDSLSNISPNLVASIVSHLINYQSQFFYQMYPPLE